MTAMDKIREQALHIARENKKAEPGIKKAYWFPHDQEVRLVEVEDLLPPTEGGEVEPYYFGSSEPDNLPSPSPVALIRTDEVRNLKLPEGWGDWESAEEWDFDS